MVSLVNSTRSQFGSEKLVVQEWEGKSTDTKPVLLPENNSSTFFEMDTGDAYKWDGDALAWILL